MIYVIGILIAYLFGSIPVGYIFGKVLKGVDIRQHGSGNVGATNVFRVVGKGSGIVVLFLDGLKGYLAVKLIPVFLPGTAGPDGQPSIEFLILLGAAAVAGHIWTVFLKFKGGKGVGTAAGMLIALFPIALPFCILIFVLTLITTGIVSLGSMLAATALPITLFIIEGINPDAQISLTLRIFALMIPVFIIFTHRSNITRMREGTENRFEKARIFKKK